MCGIVGYLGPQNGINIVLEGLRRLEYRGYDSAGISVLGANGRLAVFKKAGKLENLRNIVSEIHPTSNTTIGHTRWATHGEVNDTNAHPHISDSMAVDDEYSIAIVHNGIIENAPILKKELIDSGINFKSQTDSEVFLGLLLHELYQAKSSKKADYMQAILNAFKRIKGNSAFVIQTTDDNTLYALKKGAPLVCGTNQRSRELFVSSDPYALVGMADKVFFPDDGILCVLNRQNSQIRFFDLEGRPSSKVASRDQEISMQVSEKGAFEHYMLKEIFEQPERIRTLSNYYLHGNGQLLLQKIAHHHPKQIHISACGTAWHAGLVIKNFLERFNRIPCVIELASEFRYKNPILSPEDLAIFISQSGETADTLAALDLCLEQKIKTLAIVNVEGSTLHRNANESLLIQAGMEIGVASTKAFTLQALTGRMFGDVIQSKKINSAIFDKFNLLADRIEELLRSADQIQAIAEEIYNYKGFIFTGRGDDFPVALEGALKLKEIAYVHAEGYAAGELKHGPIALIDEMMVNLAIVTPKLYEKTVSNIQEIKARRGIIVTIGPANDHHLQEISNYYIPMNYEGLDELIPLYANVVSQLFSYYVAKFKGTDIDKPRNLAKSVTVE
ncbi:MAG: hypothetical protein A2504_10640 [Bdellovibrionales bacterium RIFOXYD12_FULL_39_22]|nr:MAG: hypothetical protein A2385_14275 [Bdellovibrionales bacterium RIFOXYB1_FULL_39_21]OFZ40401.1 MAG: hypothetical protein A2485_02965 [Bdellovibrionales bacterium RIFOXYC12_FULL_39_17]OFZ49650.1 MAG: hypothetical protein A2404_09425 [Bdellovibrionales bacterium RIFOXYC1_FULL_39_130]OFZ77320.1 MAG: hypothetical protein A2560_06090 [Bdellovibrionales bacterium RIFOXYD1_FULL_39_84]OFZ95975.1 MAG: hypothetical protein A2504_10640 [Bdellovibrionales bacterium RIFOXYD12_FULL_39_22]HLE11236.1 gl